MVAITLTSDWIQGDSYEGMLRGEICKLSQEPAVPPLALHTVSNHIRSFDVRMGVFVLKQVFSHFPLGSIHILAVQAQPTDRLPMVIAYFLGHYFISVNDGRFSLLFDSAPDWVRAVYATEHTFSELDCYIKAIRAIVTNRIESLTLPGEMKSEVIQGVVTESNCIIGQVVYLDSYGNGITNISRALYDKIGKGRQLTIYIQGPYTKIQCISQHYSDVRPGALVALFNSAGFLEVAVFMGNLALLENVSLYAEVQIQFY